MDTGNKVKMTPAKRPKTTAVVLPFRGQPTKKKQKTNAPKPGEDDTAADEGASSEASEANEDGTSNKVVDKGKGKEKVGKKKQKTNILTPGDAPVPGDAKPAADEDAPPIAPDSPLVDESIFPKTPDDYDEEQVGMSWKGLNGLHMYTYGYPYKPANKKE
jgi:hypothetical protein